MVTRAYFARRFLALKLLRAALVVGAFYDAAVATLLVGWPISAVGVLAPGPAPGPPLGSLAALWSALLALLALAAARDIRRYSAILAALVAGRMLAALLLAAAAGAAAPPTLPWLAAVNGLLAATLAGSWWPIRR